MKKINKNLVYIYNCMRAKSIKNWNIKKVDFKQMQFVIYAWYFFIKHFLRVTFWAESESGIKNQFFKWNIVKIRLFFKFVVSVTLVLLMNEFK